MSDEPHILYIGDYYDESIVAERGLPFRNAAGSNRIARLAAAAAIGGLKPIILSPATAMRAHVPSRWWHKPRTTRVGKVPVAFVGALNPGLLNSLVWHFFAIVSVHRIMRKRRIQAVIIYNFSPWLVLITTYIRCVLGIPTIMNAEDVSVPHMTDWVARSEVRPLQQLVLSICMKYIALLSIGYIVPTRKFLPYLPRKQRVLIVPGCSSVGGSGVSAPSKNVRILFSGKIEFEHGIDLFLKALERLHSEAKLDRVSVDICGAGPRAAWLRTELARLPRDKFINHGFVSDKLYKDLLQAADICVVLQKPQGRYGDLKSPSKAFEYICYGKAVVSFKVGDLDQLPDGVVYLIEPATAEALHDALARILSDPQLRKSLQIGAYRYATEYFTYEKVGLRLRDLVAASVDIGEDAVRG